MTELEKEANRFIVEEVKVLVQADARDVRNAFIAGSEWQSKQSPWISVEDRLPDPGKLVNVRCRNKNKEDGIWLCDACFIDEDTNTWGERHHTWETITHWMPIPE